MPSGPVESFAEGPVPDVEWSLEHEWKPLVGDFRCNHSFNAARAQMECIDVCQIYQTNQSATLNGHERTHKHTDFRELPIVEWTGKINHELAWWSCR